MTIGNQITWRAFLTRKRMNKNPEASMLLAVGGSSFNKTDAAIRGKLTRGEITSEEYGRMTDALERLYAQYRNTEPIVDEIDPLGWDSLLSGGHVRKTHIEKDRNDL